MAMSDRNKTNVIEQENKTNQSKKAEMEKNYNIQYVLFEKIHSYFQKQSFTE